jgi:hypothetical protein
MEFERYYIDLFYMLNVSVKFSFGKYDKADSERLFGLASEKSLATAQNESLTNEREEKKMYLLRWEKGSTQVL